MSSPAGPSSGDDLRQATGEPPRSPAPIVFKEETHLARERLRGDASPRAPSAGPQARLKTCASRNTFSEMISAATTVAAAVVDATVRRAAPSGLSGWVNPPTSGTSANGIPNESTTCEGARASATGQSPSAITTRRAGAIVTVPPHPPGESRAPDEALHDHLARGGCRHAELERPDMRSASAKRSVAEAPPGIGLEGLRARGLRSTATFPRGRVQGRTSRRRRRASRMLMRPAIVIATITSTRV